MIPEHTEIVEGARKYLSGRHSDCLESRLIAGLLQVIDCNVGQVREVYTIHKTVDDKGTKGALVGVARTKADAAQLAVGHGYFGGDGIVNSRYGYVTIDGVYLLQSRDLIQLNADLAKAQEQLRKAALARLTPEMIAALGLPDPRQNANL